MGVAICPRCGGARITQTWVCQDCRAVISTLTGEIYDNVVARRFWEERFCRKNREAALASGDLVEADDTHQKEAG